MALMRDLLDLYQSSKTSHRLIELQERMLPLLEELCKELGFQRAFVALLDPEASALLGTVGINVPEDLLETLKVPLSGPQGPLVQAFLQGKPMRVEDALTDAAISEDLRAYYLAFGMRSFAVAPLPPASGVLVVGGDQPVREHVIDDLLPYAGRLAATALEHLERQRLSESGQRHAEEKEWLWWMLNAVQDPVILSDEDNNVLFQSVAAERLLSSAPDASEGKRRAIELNNFLLSAALSSFALDQGMMMGRELTLVDPIEGDELLFEVICQSATNLITGQRGLVSVLKNVTDLRRAIDELGTGLSDVQRRGEEARLERDRLNLILENVADPIVVTDPASEIILMNPPAEQMFEPGVARGRTTPLTSYQANDAKLTSFLSEFQLEADDVRRGELELEEPEHRRSVPMGITATKVRDELGQVSAVVCVLHDLTQIRELERRTLEQQLFESEKLAAVGRLAASVAHEINNPLEAIKNSLYLLVTRTPQDDPNRRFIEIASKETERLSNIVRQMLGFYRPATVKTLTDVNRLLEEALTLLDKQLRQHAIKVVREMDPKVPPVAASADQLKQVFLNLILNAQQAMPGGGTLTLTTRLSSQTDTEFLAGRYVLVQIHDSGTGIPDEHLPHIFQPFFSTKSEAKGTGLGLWVSLGIVQNHGGQLKVRSQTGRGTTFTIALPEESQ